MELKLQPPAIPSPAIKEHIDFTKNADKLFTKVFYDYRKVKTRYCVVYGGASSSKSYSVHQAELINIMQSKEGDTLILRKYGADLRNSCYKLMQDLMDKYGLAHLFKQSFSNDNRRITYLPTGRSLFFTGVDDADRLKSIVGIKRIVLEEANQFEEEDFLELTRRARGFDKIQITLILNPISESHWIKVKLCDPGGAYNDDVTVMKFTYRDNSSLSGKSFIPDTDIKELERLKDVSENHYRIYVLAEWGIENKEGKFCWAFDRKQIKPTIHDPERITWATFDFNINPMTCTIAQVIPETQTIRAIECIKLENSDIWQMCARLNAGYSNVLWMVTGDATGQNRTAMMADNMTYYKIIQQQLRIGIQQLKVPTKNPSIEENQLLVNVVHKQWTVEIDPDRCQPLIYDLEYVEMNGKGEIIKTRTSTKKFADFLDNWRYLINVAVGPHFDFMRR